MKNGFNKGDIIVLKGEDPGDLAVGDIIVFQSSRPDPIIHRIVKKWDVGGVYYFQTKGDHNENSYASLGEDEIHEDRIIGKAIIRAPFLGWIKIGAVKLLNVIR